jgi:hypothetical protein
MRLVYTYYLYCKNLVFFNKPDALPNAYPASPFTLLKAAFPAAIVTNSSWTLD